MSLEVNIPLLEALDRCWELLADCFEPVEVGMRRSVLEKHWPKPLDDGQAA
jgi:V/A-type H+-transporting ATPase subunit B